MCEGCRIRCIGLAALKVSLAGGTLLSANGGFTVELVVGAPRDGEFRRVRCGHEHVPAPGETPEFGPGSYAGRAVFAPVAQHERI